MSARTAALLSVEQVTMPTANRQACASVRAIGAVAGPQRNAGFPVMRATLDLSTTGGSRLHPYSCRPKLGRAACPTNPASAACHPTKASILFCPYISLLGLHPTIARARGVSLVRRRLEQRLQTCCRRNSAWQQSVCWFRATRQSVARQRLCARCRRSTCLPHPSRFSDRRYDARAR